MESGQSIKDKELYTLPPNLKTLIIKQNAHFNTELVESLPKTLESLTLSNSHFTYGMLSKMPNSMKSIELYGCYPNKENGQKFSEVKFPEKIEEIFLTNCSWLEGLFPCSVLPPNLRVLNLDNTNITGFDGKLPSSLRVLTMRLVRDLDCDSVMSNLPNNLESLYAPGLQFDPNKSYNFPLNLRILDVGNARDTSNIPFSSLHEKLQKLKLTVNLNNYKVEMLQSLPKTVTSLSISICGNLESIIFLFYY